MMMLVAVIAEAKMHAIRRDVCVCGSRVALNNIQSFAGKCRIVHFPHIYSRLPYINVYRARRRRRRHGYSYTHSTSGI